MVPFLVGAGLATASTTATLGFTLTAAGSVVANVLINVGLALITMALTKQPKPQEVTSVFQQSAPVRIKHLGRLRVGGPLLFIESHKRVLYQIIYFGEGPMVAVEEHYIDNRIALLDADGGVYSEPYNPPDRDAYPTNVLLTRPGTTGAKGAVYAPLPIAFQGKVGPNWRGDGMATAMLSSMSISAQYLTLYYPNRFPQVNVLARFGEPYNPKTGARAWTDSLALLTLEYLTDPDGANIPRSMMDLDDFKRGHEVGYQIIPTKGGGSTRRYAGSLSWRLDEPPKDVISRLIMMQDGRLFLKPTGKIGFLVGEWVKPTVHIEDKHIIDAELRDSASPISEANEVVVRWTNPNANYTAATSDPWRNQAAYNRAGGRIRNITVDLYGIQSHNHARRIAKVIDHTTNAKWQGTIRTSLVGMLAWDQRFIRVSYTDLGIVAETFEVLSVTMDEEDLTVSLQIASADPSRYEFDPATEEGTAPVDPETLGDNAMPVPTGLAVEFAAATVKGRRVISGTVTCDRPTEGGKKSRDVTAEFSYARADTNKWRQISQEDDDFETEVDSLREGSLYDFRVRFSTARSGPGTWLVLENQRAIDPDPPGRPVVGKGTVRNDPLSTGERITFPVTAPSDVQTETLWLYRNTTKAFKGSTHIATATVTPGQTVTIGDPKPKKGVNYYFVRALNGSGIPGDAVAAVNNPLRY